MTSRLNYYNETTTHIVGKYAPDIVVPARIIAATDMKNNSNRKW